MEKNTQHPVAWVWQFEDGEFYETPHHTKDECERDCCGYDGMAVPLYAAQPPAVAVPDGYALVPVVANDCMRDAGRIRIQRGVDLEVELTPSECGLVWAYMVRAAAQKGGA